MKLRTTILAAIVFVQTVAGQTGTLVQQAESTMVKATRFMVDQVSYKGGYVWYYLPDMSRRWGEMEAYKTMIWMQDGGTVSVGQVLLDAYAATHNEYFYEAAGKAAGALIMAQSKEGGWNYLADFAGEASTKQWYNTIGKNGWRLEEFQHYYGNDTFDDDVSSNAARFLLGIYLVKKDPRYKAALDKAIGFLLKSQYPNGGWPQRYPLKHDFSKAGHPDYSSYYTFNDDVIWENINFLIQCYTSLGDQKLLSAIQRGMNFYLLSQKENGAWGQQYDMNMQVAGARTYEPAAYLPRATYGNAMLLMKFYEYTGDKKYLTHIPDAINWLEKVKLSQSQAQNGRYTHSLFVDTKTERPIFVHRKGSNVTYGHYYFDTSDAKLLAHMQGKGFVNIAALKAEYQRVSALSPAEAIKNSPLKAPQHLASEVSPRINFAVNRQGNFSVSEARLQEVISLIDTAGRWLVPHAMISNPYTGDGKDSTGSDTYASTYVGDKTDTSPYRDTTDQLYISTPEYIRNMTTLLTYINQAKHK